MVSTEWILLIEELAFVIFTVYRWVFKCVTEKIIVSC